MCCLAHYGIQRHSLQPPTRSEKYAVTPSQPREYAAKDWRNSRRPQVARRNRHSKSRARPATWQRCPPWAHRLCACLPAHNHLLYMMRSTARAQHDRPKGQHQDSKRLCRFQPLIGHSATSLSNISKVPFFYSRRAKIAVFTQGNPSK
jgi:hypothetical protein